MVPFLWQFFAAALDDTAAVVLFLLLATLAEASGRTSISPPPAASARRGTRAPTAAVDVTTDHRDHVSPIVLDISGESGDLCSPLNQENVESRQDEVVC